MKPLAEYITESILNGVSDIWLHFPDETIKVENYDGSSPYDHHGRSFVMNKKYQDLNGDRHFEMIEA